MLGSLEFVPVKLPGVRQEKLVACGIQEKLGHRETIPIFVGILNALQPRELGPSHPVHDPQLHVITVSYTHLTLPTNREV